MKILKYRGIDFDDYTKNEDGTYWAEMCTECAAKYGDIITDELDDGGTARGCCSVKGCCNHGDDEKLHHYIDFKSEFVSFDEVSENDDYDEQYI